MCDQCHSSPHLRGCPNAPEPEMRAYCAMCGEGIAFESYYEDRHGEALCDYCADGSRKDLLEFLGYQLIPETDLEW